VEVCNDGGLHRGEVVVGVFKEDDFPGKGKCVKTETTPLGRQVFPGVRFYPKTCQNLSVDIDSLAVGKHKVFAIVDPFCAIEKEESSRRYSEASVEFEIEKPEEPQEKAAKLVIDFFKPHKDGNNGVLFKARVCNKGNLGSEEAKLKIYLGKGKLIEELKVQALDPDGGEKDCTAEDELTHTEKDVPVGTYRPYAVLGDETHKAANDLVIEKPKEDDPGEGEAKNRIKVTLEVGEEKKNTVAKFEVTVCNLTTEAIEDEFTVRLFYHPDKAPSCDTKEPKDDDGHVYKLDGLPAGSDDDEKTGCKSLRPRTLSDLDPDTYQAWVIGCGVKGETAVKDNLDDDRYEIKKAEGKGSDDDEDDEDEEGDEDKKKKKKQNDEDDDDPERTGTSADDCSVSGQPDPPGLTWLLLVAAALLRRRPLRRR
jgi:MYXO-CTERM domain-containing protein